MIKYPIRKKLILVIAGLVILTNLITAYFSYVVAKEELTASGELQMKNGVKMIQETIKIAKINIENGEVTLDEAQESIKRYLLGPKDEFGNRPINRNIDLGVNGYFFILDPDANEIAHPTLEGQNTWNTLDMSGEDFYVAREIIYKALDDGGYTYYYWKLPYSEDVAEKVAYAEYDEEWNWVIVSSIYMEDFYKGANRIFEIMLLVNVCVFILVSVVTYIFSKHISQPLSKITQAVHEVAEGNVNIPELRISNNDETGELYKSFRLMVDNLKAEMQRNEEYQNQLSRLNVELEEIVEDRTLELQSKNDILRKTLKDKEATTGRLEKLNLDLEEALIELQSTQDELVESKKMSSLAGLVTGVAHELNTPLGIVITTMSYIKSLHEKLNKQFEERSLGLSNMKSYLEGIDDSVEIIEENLNRTVQMVDVFKQISVDQQIMSREKIDVSGWVENTVHLMQQEFKKSSVKIKLDIESTPAITTYPAALDNVVVQLIRNAMYHAYEPDVSGCIQVRIHGDEHLATVVIEDDGCGIPPDELIHIFDPFFTTNRGAGRSGLGLHIAYNMVTSKLAGKITADSIVGEGTKVVLKIPDLNVN